MKVDTVGGAVHSARRDSGILTDFGKTYQETVLITILSNRFFADNQNADNAVLEQTAYQGGRWPSSPASNSAEDVVDSRYEFLTRAERRYSMKLLRFISNRFDYLVCYLCCNYHSTFYDAYISTHYCDSSCPFSFCIGMGSLLWFQPIVTYPLIHRLCER